MVKWCLQRYKYSSYNLFLKKRWWAKHTQFFADIRIKTPDYICARRSCGFSSEASIFSLNKCYFKKFLQEMFQKNDISMFFPLIGRKFTIRKMVGAVALLLWEKAGCLKHIQVCCWIYLLLRFFMRINSSLKILSFCRSLFGFLKINVLYKDVLGFKAGGGNKQVLHKSTNFTHIKHTWNKKMKVACFFSWTLLQIKWLFINKYIKHFMTAF